MNVKQDLLAIFREEAGYHQSKIDVDLRKRGCKQINLVSDDD